MNTLNHDHQKRSPAGEPRELLRRCGLEVGHPTLNRASREFDSLRRHSCACGPKAGHLSYKEDHAGSSPAARTIGIRMRRPVVVVAGVVAESVFHTDQTLGSIPSTGIRRRSRGRIPAAISA